VCNGEYTANEKVKLVKMPESLNYRKVKIIYKFSNTKRRYTGEDYLAVFIGALADCGSDNVITTGSCFSEATCFPSVAHVNGKSIDTLYLDDKNEQLLINGFNKFGMTEQLRGFGKIKFTHTKAHAHHDSHLHSGSIKSNKIIIIKE
jgi:hypothetical protein